MGTLAFLPWLDVGGEKRFEAYSLVPYTRGQPVRADRAKGRMLDVLSEHFVEMNGSPVSNATLLAVTDDVFYDLAEEDEASAFVFTELLAIAGLSARRFFLPAGSGYCNRDHFRLVIRRFEGLGGPISVTTRRRDGSTTSLIDGECFRVRRPEHVPSTVGAVEVDHDLLEAVLVGKRELDVEAWSEIFEAIVCYNAANTDSPYVSAEAELVLVSGALERVVGSKHGKARGLRDGLADLLGPERDVSPESCARLRPLISGDRFAGSKTIRDVWIRDLYNLRSDLAHGKVEATYPAVWSPPDHLLLASFVFPFLVKRRLAKAGHYEISRSDQLSINAFELLACEEHCAERSKGQDAGDWSWTSIIADEHLRAEMEASWEDHVGSLPESAHEGGEAP